MASTEAPGEDQREADVLATTQRVLYVDSDAALLPATVLRVHYDDDPPYYTIRLMGTPREKQTVRERLVKVSGGRGDAILEAADKAASRALCGADLQAADEDEENWCTENDDARWLLHWAFLVSLALLMRHVVGLHSHSGRHTPPTFGDYEAQRHWMEITVNTPLRDWYFETEDNDLAYWGLDYPPASAYFAYAVGLASRAFEEPSVALFSSRGYDTPTHRAFMRASVYLVDLLVYVPAVLLLVSTIFAAAPVDTGRRTRDANALPRRLAAAAMLFCPSLLLIDHGHFQYNGVSIGLALAALACLLRNMRWAACMLFALSLNFKQMSLFYAPVFGCALLGWCAGQEKGTGSDPVVDAEEKHLSRQKRLQKHARRMAQQGYETSVPSGLSMPFPSARRFLRRLSFLAALVIASFAVLNMPFCTSNVDRGSVQDMFVSLRAAHGTVPSFAEMLEEYEVLYPLQSRAAAVNGPDELGGEPQAGSSGPSTDSEGNGTQIVLEVDHSGAATLDIEAEYSSGVSSSSLDGDDSLADATGDNAGQDAVDTSGADAGHREEDTSDSDASAPRNESVAAPQADDSGDQGAEASLKPSWVSTVMSTVSRVVKRFVADSSAQVDLAMTTAGDATRRYRFYLGQYMSVTGRFLRVWLHLRALQILEGGVQFVISAADAIGLGPLPQSGRGCVHGLQQVGLRVFPLARGLFEDKVANFWYVLSIPLDLRAHLEKSSLAALAAGNTLLFLLPLVVLLIVSVPRQPVLPRTSSEDSRWMTRLGEMAEAITRASANPIERRLLEADRSSALRQREAFVALGAAALPSPRGVTLVLCLTISALVCFLFGFQVHEKSILLASVPLGLLFPLDSGFVLLVGSVACYSMFPLLERDRLLVPYFCLQVMILGVSVAHRLLGMPAMVEPAITAKAVDGSNGQTRFRGVLSLLRGRVRTGIHLTVVFVMLLVHGLHLAVSPPESLPHIFPLLFCASAFAFFCYALLYLLVWLCAELGL